MYLHVFPIQFQAMDTIELQYWTLSLELVKAGHYSPAAFVKKYGDAGDGGKEKGYNC